MKKLFIIPLLVLSMSAKAQFIPHTAVMDSVSKYNDIINFELSVPQPNVVKIQPYIFKLRMFKMIQDSILNKYTYTTDSATLYLRRLYLQSKYKTTLP